MSHRPIHKILFPFLFIFLCSCTSKSEMDPWNDLRLTEQQLDLKIHETEQFPNTIPYKTIDKQLLRAGAKDNFSFYMEYYQTKEEEFEELMLLSNEGWKRVNPDLSVREKRRQIRKQSFHELMFFYKQGKFSLYGHILSTQKPNLKNWLPQLYPST